MKIHIVANLTARGLRASGARVRWLEELSREAGCTLHETRHTGEVRAVMRRALDDGAAMLVLAGGDGTFMNGVSALATELTSGGRWPRVALLPLGTVGTIARNLGERGRPEDLLRAWLTRPGEVHALPRPTLRVESVRGGAREERVGFIVGTGLVARFFEVYEARGAGGIPLAARIVARVFAGSFTGGALARRILTPIPCALAVDGRARHARGLSLLSAATVRDLGLGMKVCYRAGESPDKVHLVASSLPPARLGKRAPLVIAGRSIGGEDHVDELCASFEVRFPEGEPGPFVLDGDMFRAEALTVRPGPIVPIVGPRS